MISQVSWSKRWKKIVFLIRFKIAREKRMANHGITMIGMQKAIDNRGRYQRLIEMITRLGGPLSSPSAHLRLLYEHAN